MQQGSRRRPYHALEEHVIDDGVGQAVGRLHLAQNGALLQAPQLHALHVRPLVPRAPPGAAVLPRKDGCQALLAHAIVLPPAQLLLIAVA